MAKRATKRADKGNVYDWITERIIAMLEKGVVPWQRPWLLTDRAISLATGKAYRGVNVFSLGIAGEQYTSRYWVTFNACRQRGGHVRKGEKSTMIVYLNVGDKKSKTTGEIIRDANGKAQKSFSLLYSNVFNVEQCDGLEYPKPEATKPPVDTLEACENLIGGFTDCPTIEHKGDRAFYRYSDDSVTMPSRDTFDGSAGYYATMFHELIHSTGHKSRCNRPLESRFGSSDYAREELVAEMGAAMLCGVTGIETKTIDNSAAYIANWLQALKNDNGLVVKAARQAQRAAEYMQGIAAINYDEPTDSDKSVAQTTSDKTVAQPVAA